MRLQSILTLLLSTSLTSAQNASSATSLPFNITQDTVECDSNYSAPVFPLLPFNKYAGNPILTPNPNNNWESAFLYNPTAIVLNETVFLLYRAQNASKTSSIGLAWSTDGFNFTRLNKPIIYATEPWEHIGGTEDPRIVRVNGTFYVTYTGFDNVTAKLCLATSTDLLNWTKYPPLFPNYMDVAYSDIDVPEARINHTKSGAIVSEPTADVSPPSPHLPLHSPQPHPSCHTPQSPHLSLTPNPGPLPHVLRRLILLPRHLPQPPKLDRPPLFPIFRRPPPPLGKPPNRTRPRPNKNPRRQMAPHLQRRHDRPRRLPAKPILNWPNAH